jgi:hypothetical protein
VAGIRVRQKGSYNWQASMPGDRGAGIKATGYLH